MVRNSHFPLVAILLLLVGGINPSSAQNSTLDSLNGKIIHLYLPSDGINSLVVRNWAIPMTRTTKYWYTATLRGERFSSNQGFFFTNTRSDQFVTKEGLATIEKTRFYLADFQGKQEMWIVIDPSGPVTAKPVIRSCSSRRGS